MTDIVYVIGVIALVAIAGAFVMGRYLFRAKSSAAAVTESSSADFARLEERERLAAEQLKKLEAQVATFAAQLDGQNTELSELRKKSATDDERVAGFERTLAREGQQHAEVVQTLRDELAILVRTRDELQAIHLDLSQKVSAAERLETELRGRLSRAGQHITDRDAAIKKLMEQAEEIRTALASKESDLAASAERETGLNRLIAERDEQLKGLQNQLKTEFENIANKILTTTTNQLSEKSKESLALILEPLKNRITEFQTKVEAAHNEDTVQRSVLEERIKDIVQANQTIGRQAEDLTKALKGDSQVRGRWGEVRLERILENSGLVRGREFVVQGGDFNLKNEEGSSQRPDVIILLPEDRHFVVDSKVSLVDYLQYERAENEEERRVALSNLMVSVRSHIDSLASKNYQHAEAINSHELVFMFMPIEGVAALVLQADEHMFEYAWKRKIVMVSPSTLFMAMQTVESIWRYERQSQNAQAIAEQAGQLYDKLAGLVGDLNEVSNKITAAATAHTEAMKKLATGRGNALGRAQKLKELGVSSRKELPPITIGSERHIVDAEEELVAEAESIPNLIEQQGR